MKNNETSSSESDLVLVTGASSGIGRELARQFARNGHSLVIVAPVQGELDALAREIREEFDVTVVPVAKNLADAEAATGLRTLLAAQGLTVDILANNAGLGQRGKFWEIPVERDLEMIHVNIEAVVRLTKEFLPGMIQRGRGRILNTASVAGFEPGPTLAVYHATKAFVLSFSEALATELEDTGVTVTALCPGPVDTDFFPKADMVETRAFQKANVMAAQDVAKTAYQALMDGERVIIPGGMNKAMVFSRRMLPESGQARKNEAMYQEVPAKDHRRNPGDIERAAKTQDRGR
ncbi:MAG: short-chain dehydrogenase/reductase [Verrucomicrobia bacterium]|nr:short-chain dehydrogenase/reductase [Verrucomicrobiota bacterium]